MRQACLCAWLLCTAAQGDELQRAARGLEVSTEEMEGAMFLNGLPVSISRVTGPSVPILAERLIEGWISAQGPGSVRREQCCGWTLAARIHRGRSEVIQWRMGSGTPELIWSATSLQARHRMPMDAPMPAIADCVWTAPISGKTGDREFRQLSGRCRGGTPGVFRSLVHELDATGWRWSRPGTQVIQAERKGHHLQVIANPSAQRGDAQSVSLVLVETQPAEKGTP